MKARTAIFLPDSWRAETQRRRDVASLNRRFVRSRPAHRTGGVPPHAFAPRSLRLCANLTSGCAKLTLGCPRGSGPGMATQIEELESRREAARMGGGQKRIDA